jgi:hypothetical protein
LPNLPLKKNMNRTYGRNLRPIGRSLSRAAVAVGGALGAQAIYKSASNAYDKGKQSAQNDMRKTVNKLMGLSKRKSARSQKSSYKRVKIVGGRRYNTKGRAGPPFPRVKKVQSEAAFALKGSRYHEEDGGIKTAGIGNTMYIGHGFGIALVWEGICRSLIKNLMMNADIRITNWDDGIKREVTFTGTTGSTLLFNIGIDYVANQNVNQGTQRNQFTWDVNTTVDNPSVPVYGFVYGAADWSWDTLAIKFAAHLKTLVTGFYSDDYQLQKLRYFTPLQTTQIAWLNLQDSVITYDLKSRLKLQNRTLAGGGATNADLTTDIAANPLSGKIYETSGTFFELKRLKNSG